MLQICKLSSSVAESNHKNALIGASLSEPHVNGSALHAINIYMVRPSRKIYAQHAYGSMDISVKYSIAHSHAWVTGHSNLVNCKFTLM
jgi:hypothetical protein